MLRFQYNWKLEKQFCYYVCLWLEVKATAPPPPQKVLNVRLILLSVYQYIKTPIVAHNTTPLFLKLVM
jgi:hypothetical protein